MNRFRKALPTVVVVSLVLLASCSEDPEVAKRGCFERGNVSFEQGKYAEAIILYRNAVQAGSESLRHGRASRMDRWHIQF